MQDDWKYYFDILELIYINQTAKQTLTPTQKHKEYLQYIKLLYKLLLGESGFFMLVQGGEHWDTPSTPRNIQTTPLLTMPPITTVTGRLTR